MLEISKDIWKQPIYFQVQCDIYQEIFDLAIESLIKVRRLKKHRECFQGGKHLNEKLILKWKIIDDVLTNLMYLEIKCLL